MAGLKGMMPQYISCDAANQLNAVVRLFKSHWDAELHGYFSLKRLKKLGLAVPDSKRPNFRWLVDTKYGQYPVYARDQCDSLIGREDLGVTVRETVHPTRLDGVKEGTTLPQLAQNGGSQQGVDPSSTNNTQHRHAVSLPFDVQSTPSDVIRKDLGRKSPLERSRGSGASCTAYFPEDFQAQDWAVIKGDEEAAAVIFDQLYKFRHVHGLGADDYVSLAWAYGRELIGQRTFDRLMIRLLKCGILERTEIQEDPYGLGAWLPRGQGTGLAYGYRFTNADYRHNYSKVIIANKALQKRLKDLHDHVRYPIQKHLRKMLAEVQVVMPEDSELLSVTEGDRVKADACKRQLLAIQDGERFFSVDRKTRRIFTNLTSLRKGARKYLRVRGEPLWQIDLPCCHLLALAHQCVEAGVRDAEQFLRYCEQDFYKQLADEGGFSRDEVKEMFTRRALNAPNRHPYQRSKVMQFFRRRWKWVAKFMWKQKSNGKSTKDCPKPHNRLALDLQRWEANLVIHKICDRIRRERPGCWIATIHDAIACLESDVPFVVEVMEQELKTLGITLAAKKLAGKPM